MVHSVEKVPNYHRVTCMFYKRFLKNDRIILADGEGRDTSSLNCCNRYGLWFLFRVSFDTQYVLCLILSIV